jgi:hypothetical protein
MSFSDPQSVTLPAPLAGTTSLPRVISGNRTSTYQSADGNITLVASSQVGNRIRRVLRLDHKKIAVDPLISTQNLERSMSCYLVFDLPVTGYSSAEALAVYTGLKTAMSASSDALITKLLGGES